MILGMELGSTRIKSVLIDEGFAVVSSGSHTWENRLADGYWTYPLDAVWTGLRDSLSGIRAPGGLRAMGVSAMMHGYLAFDRDGRLLTPFRTWRNTSTGIAALKLTDLFGFNIPQRWSVAHLYQAILDGEEHVRDLSFMTTLAGYVHWRLTGEKVLGIGDASGMFPVARNDYREDFIEKFAGLTGVDMRAVLPRALKAGEFAGSLTKEGARRLGLPPSTAGCPLAPPEGDAGTGMAATNSVAKRRGCVSAGTSVFAMAVLEKPLARAHAEIDIIATPAGDDAAMVHCNNCTGEIDAWVNLLLEASPMDGQELYGLLFNAAMDGEPDCGGLLSYNYRSGEPVAGLSEGRPLFVRMPDARFTFANFARNLIYSSLATLSIGMDILFEEGVRLDLLNAHGGLYKTSAAGQRFTAAALNVPVAVGASAAEGGAFGAAILAAYLSHGDESLCAFLDGVFAAAEPSVVEPDEGDRRGFLKYMQAYKDALAIEETAVRLYRR